MLTDRDLFYRFLALPSRNPLGIEMVDAKGIYLYDKDGKEYIDLVSGISVSNLGHKHPEIIKAVKEQADKYLHLMVYGKYIQSPQVQLAKLLADNLPSHLNTTYLVNSGSEAIEGALKLAKRFTGRSEIMAFKNAYHGGTHGALSILGNEELKIAFRPLLPDIKFLEFNNKEDIAQISSKTACIVIEPIQAEAGIILPKDDFLKKLQDKCNQTNTLLILDEIQTGFGRTGKLFAFEHYDMTPDILVLAKAMGGGMPIGAFIASHQMMQTLTFNPELGHITTFGGHPVSSAAAIASLNFLTRSDLIFQASEKGSIFEENLRNHPLITEIRRKGLFIGIELKDIESCNKLNERFIRNGIIVDRFLFKPDSFRIAPPLIITEDEIHKTIALIIKSLNEVM
ncbi:aspartate aminotransferase family protein [Bacteroidota bacterium]